MTLRGARIAPGRPQSISHGVMAATLASGIFMASGYVVNVWLGRLLGPEDYGRFGVAISLLTILNVVQGAVPQAVARATAQDPASADGTLRRGVELQLGTALLLMVGLGFGAWPIAGLLGDPQLVGPLLLCALVLPPYGLLTLLIGFHNGRRFYTRQAITQATYAVTKAVGAIGLAYAFKLPGALVGYIVAACLGVMVGWHRLWAPRSSVSSRQLVRFAGPLSVYALASTGLMSVDIFFVKAMVASPDAAGYYAAGQNIARIPLFLVAGLAAIILPAVAGAGRRGVEATAATASRALRWALIIVIPMAAIILATSTPLAELVYSASYRPAGAVLAVLSPAMAALAMASIVAGILGGVGRVASPASFSVAGLAVTAVACLVLTPLAGVEGAATATLIGSLVALTGMALTLWRTIPGSLPLASLVRVGIVSIVVGSVAWLLSAEGANLLIVYAALGMLSGALFLGIREVTLREVRELIGGGRRERLD